VTSTPPLPPYAVLPRGYADVGLAGAPVAHAAYLPADLVKLAQPLRAAYRIGGVQADGYFGPNAPVTIRFFAAGLDPAQRSCGVVPLSAPIDASGRKVRVRYTLGTTKGSVEGGKLVNAKAPLAFRGRPYVDIELLSKARITLTDGRVAPAQIGQVSIGRC
jgi:hypothetical protein